MNAPYPKPQPDTTAILNALAALFQPDDVVELRSFAKGRKRTDAGYFDGEHRQALADAAVRLNKTGAAVFVTLNPINPQLLSRYANRIESGATTTTTDAQVTRRRWLLLDFDPARPSDTSATDAQLESAKAAAGECCQELQADGWPDPLAAESGNGFHLLYALDLPNDNESRDLIKGALAGLAARFDTDQVKLDQSVFNAGRITKLYGTLATKGDHTPLAPWRLSRLVATPERGAVVTADQLRAWIPPTTAKPAAQAASSQRSSGQAGGAFDLDGFLAHLGIPFEQGQHEGSERFKLAHCPFNPEHGKGEAAIFRRAGGAMGFKCQHNSCAGKGWADVRALVDGPRDQRQGPAVDFSGLLKQGQRATPESALSAGGRKLRGALAAIPRDPEPLRASVPPSEPFPVAALGVVLGEAAQALHETIKAPLPMCCQSVLAAASLAAQPHFDILLPWGKTRPLSLFLLTVGQSGERKSGVDDVVLGAAKKQERDDLEFYQVDLSAYELALDSWKQAADAARRAATNKKSGTAPATADDVLRAVQAVGEQPIPPVMPLRFLTDPTVEGQFKLMASAQPSVALFSDEGGLLIGGHALNSDNALKTMARWCKIWDGSPFDRVRAGDGASILYGRRMALHQLAQPDVMTLLLSDRMANGQGLLSRCLVAWPESTIGHRHVERFEKPEDRREIKRLFAVLKTLMEALPCTGKNPQELTPAELPLSGEAVDLAVAAQNQFETLMAPGADLAELPDRTSKALENACRIAGVMTAIDCGLAAREVDRLHLERALIIMQWYLREALRIRGAAAIPQSVLDAESLSSWLKDRDITMFRSKQVLNGGPSHLRNKPRLVAAIKELVDNGYLAENEAGTAVDGVRAKFSWKVVHHVV